MAPTFAWLRQVGPPRRQARRRLRRALRSGARRCARGLSLHHPLGARAGLHRGLSRARTAPLALRDRPRPPDLERRHRAARHDACRDRARARQRARASPSANGSCRPMSARATGRSACRCASGSASATRRCCASSGAWSRAWRTRSSREELARTAGVSLRQLERLFRLHLGRSLGEHYLGLRLDRARDLLRADHAFGAGDRARLRFRQREPFFARLPRPLRPSAARRAGSGGRAGLALNVKKPSLCDKSQPDIGRNSRRDQR